MFTKFQNLATSEMNEYMKQDHETWWTNWWFGRETSPACPSMNEMMDEWRTVMSKTIRGPRHWMSTCVGSAENTQTDPVRFR